MMRLFLQTIWRRSVSGIAFILLPVLCFANACKYDVTISMNGNVPPAFQFDRGHVNYLDFFAVKEIAPENQNVSYMDQDDDKNIVVWQIRPKTSENGRIDKLPTITYGEVPDGFSQRIPKEGAPPALIEGKVYEAGGPPVTMRKGFLRFVIKNGKAVRVPVPGRE